MVNLTVQLSCVQPQTQKMNAIIEKTALFVSKQGQQMEILIKAKQSGNPQFEFLNFENWLNPYYKHLLKYVKEGKYTPQVEREPSPPPPEEPKDPKENEASDDDDDDESDGEYELHPLLQASLHKKVGSSSSKTSSPGVEAKLSLNFVRSFHPASVQSLGVPTAAGSNNTHQATAGQELVGQHEHDAWYSTAPYQNQGIVADQDLQDNKQLFSTSLLGQLNVQLIGVYLLWSLWEKFEIL